jgi:ligand-binding sensor domain-containing protein
VFEVTWDGVSSIATFNLLDGSGPSGLGDLPINAMIRDDATGDLYVATDFTVLRRSGKNGHWHPAGAGLPMVEVSSLAIDQSKRVIYAATHGRSAWRLDLR